jgi:hypothetical protein
MLLRLALREPTGNRTFALVFVHHLFFALLALQFQLIDANAFAHLRNANLDMNSTSWFVSVFLPKNLCALMASSTMQNFVDAFARNPSNVVQISGGMTTSASASVQKLRSVEKVSCGVIANVTASALFLKSANQTSFSITKFVIASAILNQLKRTANLDSFSTRSSAPASKGSDHLALPGSFTTTKLVIAFA